MKVKNIVEGLPLTEILGVVELQDEIKGFKLPDHITNVMRLAWSNPLSDVSDDVANFVKDWTERQREWQEFAADTIARLEAEAPLPSHDALVRGDAVWPSWADKWWASVLRTPWAGQLNQAVTEAILWLDERQQEKGTTA